MFVMQPTCLLGVAGCSIGFGFIVLASMSKIVFDRESKVRSDFGIDLFLSP